MKAQTYFVRFVRSSVHVLDIHPFGNESGTLPVTSSTTVCTCSTSAPGTSWGNSIIIQMSEAKPISPYRTHLQCGLGLNILVSQMALMLRCERAAARVLDRGSE
jgi:hypothetical protein